MADHADSHGHGSNEVHLHIGSIKLYLGVFLALMVGTGLTVAAAFIDMGPMNNVVALSIAVIKATLVLTFFMHLKGGPRLPQLIAIASAFWIVLMLTILLGDYFSRGWLGVAVQ